MPTERREQMADFNSPKMPRSSVQGSDSQQSGAMSLNLSVIWHNFILAAKHLLWLPVIFAIISSALMFYRSKTVLTPTYTCKAVFAVSANYASSTDILSYNYYYDNIAASQLSSTFPYIMRSDAMKMYIMQDLGMNYIPAQVSAASVTDAGLFVLNVSASTPENAFRVANSVIRVYPQAATAVLGDTQITMIDAPVMPTAPDSQKAARVPLLKGFLMGLAAGFAVILAISLMRKTVHSAEDMRTLCNLSCLAYVPQVRFKKRSSTENQKVTILNAKTGTDFKESIRTLRLKSVKALGEKTGCKTILVTSTLPHEGKTTVSVNLALALAAEGNRTILIDADLRKQSLKGNFGIETPSEGLVELLSNKAKQFRLLNVPKSSLLLLSGDETTDSPQRLLDSRRMERIMAALRQQLDYIVIDTPPAGILSDAATLAKFVDGAIYVVRQDLANTSQIYDSIQTLSNSEMHMIGSVLNATQAGTNKYGYGSKYGYGYGYGPKYGYGYGYKYGSYGYGGYGKAQGFDEEDTDELSASLEKAAPTDIHIDK